ncbi:MAG: DUF58 domain-containing protein [Campylobacterota bacterium]|nr:DUF58 domain-containing protein [Campylobacterota bacterium]
MKTSVKKILIKTKKSVFSEIIGNNNSLFKGEGYDFVELREYEDGEDIKKIDWMISAKMHQPYVKVFHTQRELNISIVSLLNGSMHFGTKQFKQETASEVCALLGFSCVKQGDPFNSFIINKTLKNVTKKSKKIFSVYAMVEQMDAYNCIGKDIDYELMSNELYAKLKKRSIIFIVGDFFDIQNLDLRLLSKKHEVVAIIIRDQFEENPAQLGSVNLIDPSSSFNYEGVMNKTATQAYSAKINKNDHDLYAHFQSCGIKSVKIYTHEDPLPKLLKLMI